MWPPIQKLPAVIIGTGPSLTNEQLDIVYLAQENKKCVVFGMNRIFKDFPTLDYFLACNPEFFDCYWNKGLKDCKASKWTWDYKTSLKYNINFIKGRWGDGLSTDPNFIHYGHSSGFQLPGLAYNLGYRKMLLLGYDMQYAPDYNGANKKIGSNPRHYFGEYPEELQHWPSVKVKSGIFIELIEQFEKIKSINTNVDIVNCTPNSAMKCFPMVDINDALS